MSNSNRVVVVQQDSNGLGLAGLIFSCIGWLTCGLLCIPGAFLSFLGLFSKGPKGTSIAGLIVGFPGVLFFAFVGSALLAGFLGIGSVAAVGGAAALSAANKPLPHSDAPNDAMPTTNADGLIDGSVVEPGSADIADEIMPDFPDAPDSPLVETSVPESDEPSPRDTAEQSKKEAESPLLLKKKTRFSIGFREFSDVSGLFRVNAQFLSLNNGKVKLKKTDGTEIEVPLERLSVGDIAWIGAQNSQ